MSENRIVLTATDQDIYGAKWFDDLRANVFSCDTINELTPDHGVIVDGILIRAGASGGADYAEFSAQGAGTDNITLVLSPNGAGAVTTVLPGSTWSDGVDTFLGGDPRGEYAVDLQRWRTVATAVAAGFCSVIAGGQNNLIDPTGAFSFIGAGSNVQIIASLTDDAEYSFALAAQGTRVWGPRSGALAATGGNTYGEGNLLLAGTNNKCGIEPDDPDWTFSSTPSPATNCMIMSGEDNAIAFGANHSTVIGGTGHTLMGVGCTIIGGTGATIAPGEAPVTNTANSFIGAGEANTLTTAANGAIAAGFENAISVADNVFIGAGNNNFVSITASACVGGSGNFIASAGGATTGHFIGAGRANRCNADVSAVVAGEDNIIDDTNVPISPADSSEKSFIGGGMSNEILASKYSVVLAGNTNVVLPNPTTSARSDYGAIAAGLNNTVVAPHAAILAGSGNYANGQYAAILHGTDNVIGLNTAPHTLAGDYTLIGGGADNIVTGSFAAVIMGNACEAAADYTLAAGRRARALHDGCVVLADSTDADLDTTLADTFVARFAGGYSFAGGPVTVDTLAATTLNVTTLDVTTITTGALTVTGTLIRMNGTPQPRITFDPAPVAARSVGRATAADQFFTGTANNDLCVQSNQTTLRLGTSNMDVASINVLSTRVVQMRAQCSMVGTNVTTNFTTPTRLYFGTDVLNRKIVLNSTADNENQFSGLGWNALTLRVQLQGTTTNLDVYSATGAGASTLRTRTTGTGNFLVYGQNLQVGADAATTVPRLSIGSTPHFELGLATSNGSFFTNAVTNDICFRSAGAGTRLLFGNQGTGPAVFQMTDTGIQFNAAGTQNGTLELYKEQTLRVTYTFFGTAVAASPFYCVRVNNLVILGWPRIQTNSSGAPPNQVTMSRRINAVFRPSEAVAVPVILGINSANPNTPGMITVTTGGSINISPIGATASATTAQLLPRGAVSYYV